MDSFEKYKMHLAIRSNNNYSLFFMYIRAKTFTHAPHLKWKVFNYVYVCGRSLADLCGHNAP